MRGRWRGLLWLLAAVPLVVLIYGTRAAQLPNGLALGNIEGPLAPTFTFLMRFMVVGSLAAVFVALGARRLLDGAQDRLHAAWLAGSDRRFVAVCAGVAFLAALAVRYGLLHDMPVTDDESAYRFSAQLLAELRLTAPSHPAREFFDRAFLVNDGRMFTQYFLGWPALLAPFQAVGLGGLANPVYLAATVPPLFVVLQAVLGRGAARLGAVLFATSPMFVIAAATTLAHTACVAAVVWCAACVVWARQDRGGAWAHAGVGLFFAVAFTIRPTSAIGAGGPLLYIWARHTWHRADRWQAAAAFAAPATVLAAAFLGANAALTGSPFKSAYHLIGEFLAANDYRFASRSPAFFASGGDVPSLDELPHAPTRMALALVRLDHALLGWPTVLFLAIIARPRWLWTLLAVYFGAHFLVRDIGVDTFGPTHFMEAGPALLALTVAGAVEAWRRWGVAGGAYVLANVLLATAFYLPLRLGAVARIGDAVHKPFAAVDAQVREPAVVFAQRYFVPGACSAPSRHFVFWRPLPSPRLDDGVLWVNHIDVGADRAFASEWYPEREAWVMLWNRECEVVLTALDSPQADALPAGYTGPNAVPVWRCDAPWECVEDRDAPPSAEDIDAAR